MVGTGYPGGWMTEWAGKLMERRMHGSAWMSKHLRTGGRTDGSWSELAGQRQVWAFQRLSVKDKRHERRQDGWFRLLTPITSTIKTLRQK